MPTLRKWRRRLAIFLFQLALIFLLFEGGLRLAQPHFHNLNVLLYLSSVETDYDQINSLEALLEPTVLGFKPFHRRGDFVLNSRSFRTKEYIGVPKEPGTYRIMVIGDSFTFASGGTAYDKMWTTQFEQALNQALSQDVEVFSLGVPSIGPAFQLRLWELEHEQVRPDHVILAFFVGNDFTDDGRRVKPWEAEALVRFSYTIRLIRNLHRLWQEREHTEHWVLEPSEDTPYDHGGFQLDNFPPRDPNQASMTEERFWEIEGGRMKLCVKARQERVAPLFESAHRVLQRMYNEVRLSGAAFTILIIPDAYQVDLQLQQRLLEQLRLAPEDVDFEYPQKRLTAFLDEEGIPYLDLLPAFRERGVSERLYWLQGTHWNVQGNALAGQMLMQYISAQIGNS